MLSTATPTTTRTTRPRRAGLVTWYPSTKLGPGPCTALAQAADGLVLHGATGARTGMAMRKAGYEGWLALDPAAAVKPGNAGQPNLFGTCEWLERQKALRVSNFLSPGEFVPVGEIPALRRIVSEQAAWVAGAPAPARISLYLDARWIARQPDAIVSALAADADAGTAVAVALGHGADPLQLSNGVQGFVHLLRSIGDLALLRGDLAAVGGWIHGAAWTAIGTGTSNRHFQIPGKNKNSGAPGDTTPSTLVRELLGYKLGSSLMSLPASLVPTCALSCCDGRPLSRFSGRDWAEDVLAHNRETVADILAWLRPLSTRDRQAEWKAMCEQAVLIGTHLAQVTHDPAWEASKQIAQWASL